VVLCRACGKTLQCKNCAVSMTHHKRERKMECTIAGMSSASRQVRALRQRVCVFRRNRIGKAGRAAATAVSAGADRTARSRYGARREVFEHALNALNEGALDMLVGTQMIAKGHDIHGVTLVGVVGADMALGLPDFRAAERTFQLLTQVLAAPGVGRLRARLSCRLIFRITTRAVRGAA